MNNCILAASNRLLFAAVLAVIAASTACSPEKTATLANVRATPGCFFRDSSYKVVRATLLPDGQRIPFSGGLVARQIVQAKDTLWAIVPDSVPVARPITRRFYIRSNALLGIVLDAPVVLVFATDSTRGSR